MYRYVNGRKPISVSYRDIVFQWKRALMGYGGGALPAAIDIRSITLTADLVNLYGERIIIGIFFDRGKRGEERIVFRERTTPGTRTNTGSSHACNAATNAPQSTAWESRKRLDRRRARSCSRVSSGQVLFPRFKTYDPACGFRRCSNSNTIIICSNTIRIMIPFDLCTEDAYVGRTGASGPEFRGVPKTFPGPFLGE